MNDRTSAFTIVGRMFATIFGIAFACSLFWNFLSGRTMLSLEVVVWVAVVLTALFLGVGWAVVTLGGKLILGGDPDSQRWKAEGGRPYWDSLPSPMNPDSPATRGFVEPPSSEESVDGQ